MRGLIVLLGIVMMSCYNSSQMANIDHSNTPEPTSSLELDQTTKFSCDLTEITLATDLKNHFNTVGIDDETRLANPDDQSYIENLKACPAQPTIQTIERFRDQNADNIEMKAKAAYALIKLRQDSDVDQKLLVSSFIEKHKEHLERYKDPNYSNNVKNNKYDDRFAEEAILNLISDVIRQGDDKIIVYAFDLTFYTDGATSELLSGLFADQFIQDPELFLRRLKPKPPTVRERVFELISSSEESSKIEKAVTRVPKTSDVFHMTKDLQRISRNLDKSNE